MESWSYISGRKGFVANETSSTSDSSVRSKNPLMGWEIKSPYSSAFLPMENHGFGELGIHDLFRKQLPTDPVRDVLSGKLIPPTPNAFSGEDDTTSKLSSTAVDSPLIDLKLGRFGDQPKFSQGAGLILSSSESSMPPKRARLLGMSSHTAYCQVYGCNKDLSSSKDYHKRHKVCEVHSKTAKVIVNGIEQRFCQQCSRFHLLAEFDDGKRSCRKRLAGHNERRRKPQVGIHSSRSGKPLQSYDVASIGTVFQGTTLTPSSFVCQDILPHGMFHPEKTGGNDWCKRIKVEEATDYSSLSAIPITNTWNSHSNSFFPSSGEKLVPSLHDPFFHDTSLPATDFSVFYSGLSGISDSGCALSLLSSKSQNSSKIPMGRPLVIPPAGTSNSHHGTSQVSDKFGDVGPVPISESFSIRNGNYGGSDFGNAKGGGVSSEDGATIDLLQLSSQLQRVEHQRQSMQCEHENDAFCCLRIT